MSTLRVSVMRLFYRVAYWVWHAYTLLTGRPGRGVKCLLTNSGQVLLVRHTYGQRGVWYLPGGGIRRGEQPLAAGLREMHEELGLDRLCLRELATLHLPLERMTAEITCLHAELSDRELHPYPGEIAQARWFDLDDLPEPVGLEVKRFISLLDGGTRE
jgi:8-oxo-dGTP pyrophosphatase MutT (NUDIX family)